MRLPHPAPLLALAALLAAFAIAPVAAAPVTLTDDFGRTVSLPGIPQRIVALDDVDLTIPLIELGARPVGSLGRIGTDGQPRLRAARLLTGVDFDTSDIAFVGVSTPDLERILALKPDLIVTEPARTALLAQLARIAPTVVIDTDRGAPHIYRSLAALTGTGPRLAELEARYASQIAQLRETVTPDRITVSVMLPLRGRISVYHSYRALGQVLRDAGFRFVPLIEAIPAGGRINISPERLPELDADYIFDPYRSDRGQGPEAERARLEELLPGFCSYLAACARGNLVFLPREEAISNSYAAMGLLAAAIQASLSRMPPATPAR